MKGLLFTYVLCYGGSVVALFNPFVGLLVYICFAIIRPESLWPWAVPPGNYSRTVAIALLVGWVAKGFGDWRLGRAFIPVAFLAGYGLTLVATTQAAVDPEAAWKMVETGFKIIVPFLVGLTTVRSMGQLRTLAWVIVLSEGYVALDFNLSYLGGYNRLWFDGFGSLDNNGCGVGLVTCAAPAGFLALYSDSWLKKGLAAGAGLLIVHAILFSFSRGAMLSLLITGSIAFLIIPKRPIHYILFALAVLIVLRLAGDSVVSRFSNTFVETGEDASADRRRILWAAALKSITEHPLGVGPDQWRLRSREYGEELEGWAVHSTWLHVGAEMGVLGVAALLLFYLTGIARLWPIVRGRVAASDPWADHLARMVIASLLGFMVAAQFVTLHMLEIPYYIALIGAGLLKLETAEAGKPATWVAP